jgi:hypothetical protein
LMGAKDKDDSKLRRREEMLARRVGEALDQFDPRAAVECPDAEVIAAYAEQTLESAESARWEGHFAACARCRKILRLLAASDDTPLAEKEVARLGELVSAARSPAGSNAKSPASGRPGLRGWGARWPAAAGWLAPALGVAAVLAVWIAMRGPWRTTQRGTPETLVAQAPREEAPPNPVPTDQLSKAAPERTKQADETAPVNRPPANAPANKREIDLPAIPSSLPPAKAKAMETYSASQPDTRAEVDAAKEGLQAEAPGDALSQDKKSPAPQRAPGVMAVPELSARVATNARGSENVKAVKTTGTTPIQATSPFGTTIWRAGSGGRIEYSADSGQSWALQVSPSQEDWLAGVAVSDTVCWLAGRNGAIARTADGEHWERVAPPAQSAGTNGIIPDWSTITARDARSATVTAKDGRRFTTSDGGAAWQAQ